MTLTFKPNRANWRLIAGVFILGTFFLTVISGCSKNSSQEAFVDKGRQASICANQLKMLANAKKLWAQKNNKTAEDTPAPEDLARYIACDTKCPFGGTYTLGKVGEQPTCSIPEHQAAFLKKMEEQSGQGQTNQTQ
jgi:hypothetical protein